MEYSSELNWRVALTPKYWLHTFLSAITIILSILAVWLVAQLIENTIAKSLVAAAASLTVYISLK